MKIVFFYIVSSKSGYIQEQGFNFSSNYKFEIVKRDGCYCLCERKVPRTDKIPEDFFSPFEDISAIVGKNGAGKTTLLAELCNLVGSNKRQGRTQQYSDFFQNRYERNRRLVIVKEDNVLRCFHNIDGLRNNAFSKVQLIDYNNEEGMKSRYSSSNGMPDFTTIIATNGRYEEFGETIYENANYLNNIVLSPNTMSMLGKRYFDNAISVSRKLVGGYHEYLERCADWLSKNNFQSWLYIHFLAQGNGMMGIRKWFQPICKIQIMNYSVYVKDVIENAEADKEEGSFEKLIDYANGIISQILRRANFQHQDYAFKLYIDLLFEILVDNNAMLNGTINVDDIKDADGLERYINYLCKGMRIRNTKRVENALLEIKDFISFLKELRYEDNGLPERDFGYDGGYVFDLQDIVTIERIDSVFTERSSFLLKYVKVKGFTASSGEKAIVDIFSWLDYILGGMQLKKDVLFLFDEIDLYLHPEWQQKFVYELTMACNALLPDKNVHLVYSTHSPITLSDMPRGNVIFLNKSKDNKCIVEDSMRHGKTFGNNIYLLYDDAFFLSDIGQVGEFARNRIKKLIDAIAPQDGVYIPFDEEAISRYEADISIVGDEIIRGQLFRMLYLHRKSVEEDKNSFMRKRIDALEYEISRLKALEGDT